MHFPFFRRPVIAMTLAMTCVIAALAGCTVPSTAKPPPQTAMTAPLPPPASPVRPVEAEPRALATQPDGVFSLLGPGPAGAMLAYADKVRPLAAPDLAAELARLAEIGDMPTTQMQAALVLAQTRNPSDLARAQGLLQKVLVNPSAEAQPLQPLARTLAARLAEQRRAEEERDKQAQALREALRRIDQLNDRIEALRAIERSVARPASVSPPPAAPAAAPKAAP